MSHLDFKLVQNNAKSGLREDVSSVWGTEILSFPLSSLWPCVLARVAGTLSFP